MKEKVGIIDVGGGLRDVYGAGIFDYLMDQKIDIPYCIGVSAGSANVASYVSGQRGRNLVFYTEYTFEKEYMSMRNLRKKGSYINLDYIYGTLSNEGGKYPWDYDSAMKSDKEMVVVASNAETGRANYFYKKDYKKNDYGMLKASSNIPFIDKPYEWNGKFYYDGAITDAIPYKRCFKDGCTRVIVILTRPKDFRKETGASVRLYKTLKKRFPKFVEKMYARNDLYNRQLDDLVENYEPEGKVLIVAPSDTCGMDTLTKDKEKMKKLYNKGYEDGKAIKKYLKNIL